MYTYVVCLKLPRHNSVRTDAPLGTFDLPPHDSVGQQVGAIFAVGIKEIRTGWESSLCTAHAGHRPGSLASIALAL